MKKLLAIAVVGLFAASSAALAGEGLKKAGYGGCGYGASLKSVSAVPTITPVPTKSVTQASAATTKTGG